MMVCLIFHTAITINRKNWKTTIKLYLENLGIFFKKRTYTHAMTPLPLFIFVCFSMTAPPSLPSSTNVLFEWPLLETAPENVGQTRGSFQKLNNPFYKINPGQTALFRIGTTIWDKTLHALKQTNNFSIWKDI